MLIPCVVLVPFIIIFASKLDILNLGDEIAVGLESEQSTFVIHY